MPKCLLPILFLLVSLAAPLRADLLVERTVSRGAGADVQAMRLKFKGDKARIELPAQTGRQIILLIDIARDEIANLIPDKKQGYIGSLSKRRAARELSMKSHGIEAGQFRPTPTGEKKKIGRWDCEEYIVSEFNLHIWVAPDFPRWREIQAQLARFSQAESGGALSPDCFGLPGLVVQAENPGAGGTEVTTLVNIREEPLPDTDFALPEGYQLHAFPEAPAATALPKQP